MISDRSGIMVKQKKSELTTLLIISAIILFVVFLSGCSKKENEKKEAKKEEIIKIIDKSQIDPPVFRDYNDLQKIFLITDFNITIKDLKKMVLEYDVDMYRHNNGNVVWQYEITIIGETSFKKTWQRGKEEYLAIYFDRFSEEFEYAEYWNPKTYNYALIYNYGHYKELNEKEAGNAYNGYYWYNRLDYSSNYYNWSCTHVGGIKYKDANGTEHTTGLYCCDSKERAIDFAVNEIPLNHLSEYDVEQLFNEE